MSEGFNKKGLCKLCKEPRTRYGDDPCIANLPGVSFACCGHGRTEGYIKFEDGRTIYFKPLRMILDPAQHEVVRPPVAVYRENEPYRMLMYKSGKVKPHVGKFPIDVIEDQKVVVRKRDLK